MRAPLTFLHTNEHMKAFCFTNPVSAGAVPMPSRFLRLLSLLRSRGWLIGKLGVPGYGSICSLPIHYTNREFSVCTPRTYKCVLGIPPPLEEIMLNTKIVKHLADGLMDNIFNSLWAVIKGYHWRQYMSSQIGSSTHET